jgi:hypothetical protein
VHNKDVPDNKEEKQQPDLLPIALAVAGEAQGQALGQPLIALLGSGLTATRVKKIVTQRSARHDVGSSC